ncbi:PC-esterase domain-containing protein 1A, partial [Cetorhinus maximus]
LLRFYFLTQIYSDYVESVLADFQGGPQPDVVIVNSCVWDISRYGSNSTERYRENLDKFFTRLKQVLLPECLVIWNMAMPLDKKIKGGFLIPELQCLEATLRCDVIEASFYSALLAAAHGFEVVDLHFQFRFELQHRAADGIHWSQVVHRQITVRLLQHIADAWGVALSFPKPQASVPLEFVARDLPVSVGSSSPPFSQWERWRFPSNDAAQPDFILDCLESAGGEPWPGYSTFTNYPAWN